MPKLAIWQGAPAASVEGSLEQLEKLTAEAAKAKVQALVLPELFLGGYDLRGGAPQVWERAVERDGPELQHACSLATTHRVALVFGFVERGPEEPAGAGAGAGVGVMYNSCCCIDQDGAVLATYAKCHLFGWEERSIFAPGRSLGPVVSLLGLRVGLLICYDLEFAEAARCLALEGADMLIVPTANFPPHEAVNAVIVAARALENHVTVAYVNWAEHPAPPGTPAFNGGSCVVGPKGQDLLRCTAGFEGLRTADVPLSFAHFRRAGEDDYLGNRRPDLYSALKGPPEAESGGGDGEEGTYNEGAVKGRVEAEVGADVVDLSQFPFMVSDCFPAPPRTPDQWEPYLLSDAQVKAFERDGYVSNVPLLTEEQCDALIRSLESFTDPRCPHPGHGLFHEFHSNQSGDPQNVLVHALGHWRIEEACHDLVFHPGLAAAAAQLLRAPVRFWHDQIFAKPANHGGCVAWHQDYSYWQRSEPMNHITIHVALDAQDESNGGLHFIPGSHRWHRGGRPLPITDANFADMDSIQKVLTAEEAAMFKPVCAGLRKGEASFHHGLSVHGSFPNRSPRPRRACVVNAFEDGTHSNTEGVMLPGTPWRRAGDKLDGQFHPLLTPPSLLKTLGFAAKSC